MESIIIGSDQPKHQGKQCELKQNSLKIKNKNKNMTEG